MGEGRGEGEGGNYPTIKVECRPGRVDEASLKKQMNNGRQEMFKGEEDQLRNLFVFLKGDSWRVPQECHTPALKLLRANSRNEAVECNCHGLDFSASVEKEKVPRTFVANASSQSFALTHKTLSADLSSN